MKTLIINHLYVLCILLTTEPVFAHEKDPKTPKAKGDVVKEVTTPEKPSGRKKKVEICADCGKPETECECDEETKKKEAERKQNWEKK